MHERLNHNFNEESINSLILFFKIKHVISLSYWYRILSCIFANQWPLFKKCNKEEIEVFRELLYFMQRMIFSWRTPNKMVVVKNKHKSMHHKIKLEHFKFCFHCLNLLLIHSRLIKINRWSFSWINQFKEKSIVTKNFNKEFLSNIREYLLYVWCT